MRVEIKVSGGWLQYKSGLTFSTGSREHTFFFAQPKHLFLPSSRFEANGKKTTPSGLPEVK